MNPADRIIATARGILAEEAELERQFPWLVAEADKEGFDGPGPMSEQDSEIYERYIAVRVRANLAAETLRVWGVQR